MKYQSLKGLAITTIFAMTIVTQALAAPMFDTSTLEGHTGPYLVIKNNVNVRDKPASTGEKVIQLPSRDIVTVKGRVKGTQWLAISKKGNNLGYIYASSLTPMIDASLKEPIASNIDLSDEDKGVCDYNLTFEGRAIEEDTIFVSADYQVTFNCTMDNDQFDFSALVFMSEVPPDLGQKPVYQITLNLPDIATGYEEFLSATALFNQAEQQVIMDAVSLEQFKEKALRDKLPATTPQEALQAALKLQLSSFNKKAWRIIAGEIPNPSELKPQ
ncbi:MAG: SH3 domain-containing protein [Terasakiella sp.]|uniref:SH3 domain-containing protein n=1 Tax=unclassified Terasakiella TaxID=2614952 RepID=UPI003AFFA7E2